MQKIFTGNLKIMTRRCIECLPVDEFHLVTNQNFSFEFSKHKFEVTSQANLIRKSATSLKFQCSFHIRHQFLPTGSGFLREFVAGKIGVQFLISTNINLSLTVRTTAYCLFIPQGKADQLWQISREGNASCCLEVGVVGLFQYFDWICVFLISNVNYVEWLQLSHNFLHIQWFSGCAQ